MRVATLVRRLPWLAIPLAGCADDVSSASESSTGGTTEAVSTTSSTSVPEGSTTSGTTTGQTTTGQTTTGQTTTGQTTTGQTTTGQTTTGETTGVTTTGVTTTGETATGETTGQITTGGRNAAPEAVDDVVFTAQNDAVFLVAANGLLSNDTDLDGDPLTVTDSDAVSAAGGTVVIDDDGALAYDPAAGFWGPDTFEYTIEDGGGATATATVTVHVAPIQIPLAEVTAGGGGFVLDGEAAGDGSGVSVSGAGDVNGDGMGDLIVGADLADPNGTTSGRSYVVFGKADTTAVPLSDITGGMGGFAIDGEAAVDHAGRSVSGAGDVNGDGMHDIIVGAFAARPDGTYGGRSYVVFGKSDTAGVQLSAITAGVGGFVLDGAAGDQSGSSVSGAGDVNGDGIDDLIIGAYRADPNGSSSGRSYVVFGKADTDSVQLSAITAGNGGFVLDGEVPSGFSGISVSGAGDVNGDGMDDLIVGAPGAYPNGFHSGRSYVVFGKADTAAVQLSAITAGIGGFVLDGEGENDDSGRSVSGAGDVNDDGMDDIIVGAYRADPNGSASGRSYVVFGKTDTVAVQLSAIAGGAGGFVLDGEAGGDLSGFSVSGAGDVNGDGIDDLLVGADGSDPNGDVSGRSYVVFGKADTTAVELSTITGGMHGFVLDGEAAYDSSGRSVSGAGDVNGDGMDDIIIGALGADPNGDLSGRSYVVFGVPTGGG